MTVSDVEKRIGECLKKTVKCWCRKTLVSVEAGFAKDFEGFIGHDGGPEEMDVVPPKTWNTAWLILQDGLDAGLSQDELLPSLHKIYRARPFSVRFSENQMTIFSRFKEALKAKGYV